MHILRQLKIHFCKPARCKSVAALPPDRHSRESPSKGQTRAHNARNLIIVKQKRTRCHRHLRSARANHLFFFFFLRLLQFFLPQWGPCRWCYIHYLHLAPLPCVDSSLLLLVQTEKKSEQKRGVHQSTLTKERMR